MHTDTVYIKFLTTWHRVAVYFVAPAGVVPHHIHRVAHLSQGLSVGLAVIGGLQTSEVHGISLYQVTQLGTVLFKIFQKIYKK